MVVAPPEDLAQLLGEITPAATSSLRLQARAADLHMDVEGIGQVKLPVSAAQATRLCELGRPARFGRGHIHDRIQRAELPVTHQTRRKGSPYVLVLTKNATLFTREREGRLASSTGAAIVPWTLSGPTREGRRRIRRGRRLRVW